MTALDAALDVWDDVNLQDLYAKSKALCQILMKLVEEKNARHGLTLFDSRDTERRGSHVSFHCPEGYPVMQALIVHGVIGDFRRPDVIRFSITPLFTSFAEIWDAAAVLTRILYEKLWTGRSFWQRNL